METALKVALIADEIMPDDMLSGRNLVRKYVRTFSARLILSSEELKDRFAAVSNELLKFDRVKMRISRRFATFNRGRMIIARMNVVGKTLKIYLPLKYAEVDEKYRALDVSDKKRFVGTPVCLKIRSNRGARYAIELVNKYASENDFALAKKPRVIFAEDYPLESNEDLILKGFIIPVWRKSGAVPFGENPTERTFFGSAKIRLPKRAPKLPGNLPYPKRSVPQTKSVSTKRRLHRRRRETSTEKRRLQTRSTK